MTISFLGASTSFESLVAEVPFISMAFFILIHPQLMHVKNVPNFPVLGSRNAPQAHFQSCRREFLWAEQTGIFCLFMLVARLPQKGHVSTLLSPYLFGIYILNNLKKLNLKLQCLSCKRMIQVNCDLFRSNL